MKVKNNKVLRKLIILIFVIFIISSYAYERITIDVPINLPKVTIKYSGKEILTSPGEYAWLKSFSKGQPKTGNSYLAGPSYDVGVMVESFSAKSNSDIKVIFKSAPPEIILRRWTVGDSVNEVTKKFDSLKKINNITLPEEKGEYIYEVQGYWSNTNFTSTVFRVLIE